MFQLLEWMMITATVWHNSNSFQTSWKINPGFNGNRTHDLCVTGLMAVTTGLWSHTGTGPWECSYIFIMKGAELSWSSDSFDFKSRIHNSLSTGVGSAEECICTALYRNRLSNYLVSIFCSWHQVQWQGRITTLNPSRWKETGQRVTKSYQIPISIHCVHIRYHHIFQIR